jgi:hypothetical protein
LKVIELREELTGYGMEMKDVRKIKKAQLVELVLKERPHHTAAEGGQDTSAQGEEGMNEPQRRSRRVAA